MGQANNHNISKELSGLRSEIDSIDGKIVDLLNKRLLIGKKIGKVKEKSGNKVLDTEREKKIKERLSKLNKGPLNDNVLLYIFNVIMAATREIQKPTMVSYLGPEATYSHVAAINYFGHSGTFVPKTNIRDIFLSVEKGESKYGVVPVENSIEGAVNHTLDELFEHNLKISAEKYQPISHSLLSKSGHIDDVHIICSHPQPLAQCREWIYKNLPNVVIEECSSTAYSAQKAVSDSRIAAIASNKAAEIYNLKTIETKIADTTKNVTRFLVIGNNDSQKTGRDKTSIMFVTSHIPGALFKALEPASKAGLNMVKLESRPSKRENWSYFFIMDIEGHVENENVKQMMNKMKEICLFFKCLGSYENMSQKANEVENI